MAFHGTRLPLYWVRLLGRSPFGVARLLGVWWRWGTDPDGRQMRSAMNTAGADPAVFVRLTEQHKAAVRTRLLVTALVGALAGHHDVRPALAERDHEPVDVASQRPAIRGDRGRVN